MKQIAIIVLLMMPGCLAMAADLKTLVPLSKCSALDMQAEPMGIRRILVDSTWADFLKTGDAKRMFDAAQIQRLKADSGSVRERLASEHVVQELDRRFETLRQKAAFAVQAGEFKPVEPGKTYSRGELEERQRSQAEFNRANVQPVLVDAYRFFESVFREREGLKGRAGDVGANERLLKLVETQRSALNEKIAQTLPTLEAKLGKIPKGNLHNLPFSYRDGRIAKIHFAKPDIRGNDKTTVFLYPRMLLNSLLGRDQYFIDALTAFRDYAKLQYETAFENKISVAGWFLNLIGEGNTRDEDLRVRRLIYQGLEEDLRGARKVHDILATLSNTEILSLLDLFRELQGDNVPGCAADVRELNSKMRSLLAGRASSADKSLDAATKKKIDQLAKDTVFFQDMYSTFSEASAILLSKDKVPRAR